MKRSLIFIFLAAFLSLGLSSCGDKSAVAKNSIAKDVDTATFKKMMDEGKFTAIDVRAPKERLSDNVFSDVNKPYGFIPGTPKNINWKDGAAFKAGLSKLDKSKPYGVYCRSGNRSGKAMNMMHNMGFKEVYNLAGGMKGWLKAGYESEVVPK